MEIYKLGPILNDPRFGNFSFGDLPSLTTKHSRDYDFTHYWPKNETFSIPRLKRRWDCPELTNQDKVAPFNDFPCCGFYVPVFSSRAADALAEFLKPNGELLPVRTARGQYFAYQTTTIADGVVDIKKCVGDLRDDAPIFSYLDKYAFYKSKLRGLTIFRIREDPSPVLVTSVFKDAVERNKLNGFRFKKLWPVPSRAEVAAEKARRKKRVAVKAKGRQRGPQDETIVLALPIEGEQLSAAEQRAIDKIRAALNAQLVLQSMEQEYFGSTEGYEIAGGSYHLLISCPDADRLLVHLAPLLSKLKWRKPFTVVKRAGAFWDEQAPESAVDLAELG